MKERLHMVLWITVSEYKECSMCSAEWAEKYNQPTVFTECDWINTRRGETPRGHESLRALGSSAQQPLFMHSSPLQKHS